MNEEWRDLKGYEGIYQVSNSGNIKALKQTVVDKNGKNKIYKEHIITPTISKNKESNTCYCRVMLTKNHIHKRYLLHRLIAETFIQNPFNKEQVNHIDGNGANNNVSNLEWCTPKENMKHAWEIGLLNETSRIATSERNKQNIGKNNPLWKGYINIIDSRGNHIATCETLKQTETWVREHTQHKKARLSHIGEVCQGKAKQAYGYKFERSANNNEH